MMALKLVTFDVTGTLLFFRTPVFEKYIETGIKFGIRADSNVVKSNMKEAWTNLNSKHPNYGKDSGLGWQAWWKLFVQEIFTGYVKPDEDHKITEMAEDLIAFHTTKEAFRLRPGSLDLLEYLKTRSVKLGIISNYDPRLCEILEFMNLKHYFDFVLVSYEFGCSKPDARIFHEALKLGKCQFGNEAIHVGDDLKLDYLAAKEAGMRALLLTSEVLDLNNRKIERKDVFEDFFQVKTYMESLK